MRQGSGIICVPSGEAAKSRRRRRSAMCSGPRPNWCAAGEGVPWCPSPGELRGVPVVGSGPGATPGSNPVSALLAKERRRR